MLKREVNILKSDSFFLFGARGVGKTSWVKKFLPPRKSVLIDLLNPADYEPLLLDPGELLARVRAFGPHVEWVFIDEIQKLPKLLDVVHKLIEERHLKFALTGSSARKLKRGGANLLAGRAFAYEMHPFTAHELGGDFNLQKALEWGTLPKAYLSEDREARKVYLETYVHTYLREEIQMEQIIRALDPFRRFLGVAAQLNGEPINFAAIARDVGTSDQTVKSYFQILEDTLLGFFVESYKPSLRKRQRDAPKFYLFDVGVARALRREVGLQLRPQHYGYGKLFEHFVVLDLLRRCRNSRNNFEFSYIRTAEGVEVDLVIERPGAPLALVEIKSSQHVIDQDTKLLQRFCSDMPKSKAYCLSRDPHSKRFAKVNCLPWDKGIEEIMSG